MAHLTGLFQRGSSYYLRVVLPVNHPLRSLYKSGKIITSLGQCSKRVATIKGITKKAELLSLSSTKQSLEIPHQGETHYDLPDTVYLCDIYKRWKASKPRSSDSINSCLRSLKLYEEFTGNPPIKKISRAQGDGFRSWLQQPERKTTSKTARDRLIWVKSLLKYAQIELELIPKNPWEGLDIAAKTTHRRRPWSETELQTLFTQSLFTEYALPNSKKSGKDAAYWIPLIGLYTGARISELAQLATDDIKIKSGVPTIAITNEGENQQVKTLAGIRTIPIHNELIRLGFLEYISDVAKEDHQSLWPHLIKRPNKPGGYFSNWFGEFKRTLGFNNTPDFHSFRHLVRSQLTNNGVAELVIDSLLGHQISGSMGAKIYTHLSIINLNNAIQTIQYPYLTINKIYTRKYL